MTSGPLGKYSQIVAAGVAVFVIVAAVTVRIIEQLTGTAVDTSFLDNIALIAIGAIFGASASTSVHKREIDAAHTRLDIIEAPPAAIEEEEEVIAP